MGFLQILTNVVIGICATLYARDKTIELLQARRLSRQKAPVESAPKISVIAKPLNASVYELYRPQEGIEPKLEVVFFHGFQHGNYKDAHLFTWLSSGDELCVWPQDWLKHDFPDARILTVSYNGGLHMKNPLESGDIDLPLLVENLQSDLLEQDIGQDRRCPVVLVGHSFGGLVIKKLCVRAFSPEVESNSKLEYFLNSLKGIFFYSTPHHGISAPKGISFVNPRPGSLMTRNPLLPYMEIHSKETARLNSDFDKLWNEHRTCKFAGLGENVASTWGTFHGLVVPEGSSRYGIDFLIEPGADHISISRPSSKICRRFTHLTRLLHDTGIDSNIQNKHPENFQELPDAITGIGEVVEDLKRMLVEATKTTSLGFYGMVGIGKTTLAKHFFNNIEPYFDYTCFIEEDEIQVSNIIVQNMHYRGRKVTENAGRLKFKMKSRKLLLVLDGVNSNEDFSIVKRFIRDIDVDDASLFVATSRDKELLASRGFKLHPIELLCIASSKDLFLKCAPNGHNLPFKRYVDDIVEQCDKLPLTLEVVGEYLSTKSEESDWSLILGALDDGARNMGILVKRLWPKLRISYDNLIQEEKDMFLDAATVFYKCDISIAKAAWSSLGEYQRSYWQRLVNFSLVWEDHDEERTKIGMQKQLLTLGRMIALTRTENGKIENGWRIWNDNEKAFELLSADYHNMNEDDLQDVVALKSCSRELDPEKFERALGMDLAPQNYIPISGSELSQMRELKYLWLEGFKIDQLQDSQLPSKIVYLHLSSMSFSDFPIIPRSHRHMIILSLHEIDGFRTLPADFCKLRSLQILSIEDNTNLEGLPLHFGNLINLKHLSIKLCPTLSRLPKTLGDLVALETLSIASCSPLLALPESIGKLKTLKVVEIMGYDSESLPDSLGELPLLRHLRIEGCPALRSLPDDFRKLTALETLTIARCDVLSKLPNSLEYLSSLKVIRITRCNSLKKLPRELEEQRALEHIELNEIYLRSVPNLEVITSLKTLRLSWGQTSTFPSLPECLQGQVTEENYTSPLTFNVVNGIFQVDPAGNFQDGPTGIVGTRESM